MRSRLIGTCEPLVVEALLEESAPVAHLLTPQARRHGPRKLLASSPDGGGRGATDRRGPLCRLGGTHPRDSIQDDGGHGVSKCNCWHKLAAIMFYTFAASLQSTMPPSWSPWIHRHSFIINIITTTIIILIIIVVVILGIVFVVAIITIIINSSSINIPPP